jgi:hypothetical protein
VRRQHQLLDSLAIVVISSVASGCGHHSSVITFCAKKYDGLITQASEQIHFCFLARYFGTHAPAIHDLMNL